MLGQLRHVPANRMVNEAVGQYLRSQTAAVEAELKETLRRVSAYRDTDPNFESAIAKFAEAEATLAANSAKAIRLQRQGPLSGWCGH